MSAAILPVTMPKWGIEMTEGTVNGWTAQEGQVVGKGEPLLEVETDKIVNTVEAPFAGTLRRIVAAAGEVYPVGSLIAVLAEASVSDADVDEFIAGFRGASVSFEPDAQPGRPARAAPAPAAAAEQLVSPVAARLAESLGVDITRVKGTGRNGRVMKEDVEAYVAASASTTQANPVTRVRMSAARLVIARRLTESKQSIPHYRLKRDVRSGELLGHRRALHENGTRVSINDLIVRASALALTRHPAVNAQVNGEEILQYAHADIAIAVATQGGLMTPIVRGADLKSVAEIARESAELARRARDGALTREQITGGTFTVSNLGMYGLDSFDAIINPPQVAILAVGALSEKAVVAEGNLTAAAVMTLTLSADHRVVDGAVAAQFLASLAELLEKPAQL
ncbi:MAG TPA: dihydrolipoamide acetyltransferase family protein [Steroidobacteraceae bacterium]|jgi:pyruvate dehydrogenase E2 component (dihydrolipoamide acetyltransferase)